jgi:hypothetical protein
MKPSRSLRKKAFDSCRARNILCALPVDFDCAGENARWGEMVEVFHGKSEIESRPQGWRQSEEEFIETWGRTASARSKTGAKRKSAAGARKTARKASGRKTARKASGRKASRRSTGTSARSTRTTARKQSRSSGQRGRKSRGSQTSGEEMAGSGMTELGAAENDGGAGATSEE